MFSKLSVVFMLFLVACLHMYKYSILFYISGGMFRFSGYQFQLSALSFRCSCVFIKTDVKIGFLLSRSHIGRDSGFSSKIERIPTRSGWLDILNY